MLDLRTLLLAVVASFAVGAASSWWVTADYKNAKHDQIMAEIYKQSAKAVQDATEKAIAVERENNRLATELEVANNEFRANLDTVKDDNRRLVNELSGLYDRNATCDSGTVSSPSKPSSGAPVAPAGSKLSAQLTELLLSESRRADEAAAYAKTCYDWVKKLK